MVGVGPAAELRIDAERLRIALVGLRPGPERSSLAHRLRRQERVKWLEAAVHPDAGPGGRVAVGERVVKMTMQASPSGRSSRRRTSPYEYGIERVWKAVTDPDKPRHRWARRCS